MGDFAAPAAAANGSSICINNNLNSSLSGAGIGVSSTPHGPPAAAAGNNNANSGGIPKHSTVVERLRQRIEGCRRHHVNCESRYQQAQAEQLELERRDTVSLYQRTLEQRAKKTGTGGKQQHQSKQQQDAEPPTAEQRNHTLIMVEQLLEAVFRNPAIGTLTGEVMIRSVKKEGMSWPRHGRVSEVSELSSDNVTLALRTSDSGPPCLFSFNLKSQEKMVFFPPQSPDQMGFTCAQVVKVSSGQSDLINGLFYSLGTPDSLLQLALSSWLAARQPQCKAFSDPVHARDPSKSSVSFCPVAHDPVPHVMRSDVLAAAVDVKEACGEQVAITP
ncbi:hypothetical protein DUI87_23907 [Hirundo rustica rustica]|uniref:Neurogenic mastermind-like N-terminal domain-containing protein n=1 Tax=Hirundo rustica rustica TaxID=333673 RepID=A0A3M0JKR9_HIRRU|nr:hypothetical protein DUI87_23907 [Hirundo rustica rustica]